MSKDEYFGKNFAHIHAKQKRLDEQEDESRKFSNKRKFFGRFSNPLSDYIYGTNAVYAALNSNKRTIFSRILVYKPELSKTGSYSKIIKMCKEKEIPIEVLDSKQQLISYSNNNVHNGVILECNKITPTSIRSLNLIDNSENNHEYSIIRNSIYQDELEENTLTFKTINKKGSDSFDDSKYPLALFLDEITDSHNMGAIIRSAYFLGVDFIVMTAKNCASLSASVSKSSSGAVEFMNIFSTDTPLKFFDECRQNGWTFISTAVFENNENTKGSKITVPSIETADLSPLLDSSPCVLVLGSESKGVRKSLVQRSDYKVQIRSPRPEVLDGSSSIDSLNVSVASSLLISKFVE
ncbi:Mrm1p ASCRUDRAFT_81644 [Ascoidea rubescens DSM 1968]|uniref:rRNA methyltransferase 1, mitochondrial n=1 Tax=Ascoidea rubescens DSM 1968 TaxID=1344418 RepID=A0A1D2VF11_9ASCO|nr:hypothetical protein ASCRUDRAFT_81644 [Ascoidea rubescens DSM 1968]ODV60216.1 hypothetical protein ASCRUDRAFT_81644 [Ascoidea rubescens DSM 1968]